MAEEGKGIVEEGDFVSAEEKTSEEIELVTEVETGIETKAEPAWRSRERTAYM